MAVRSCRLPAEEEALRGYCAGQLARSIARERCGRIGYAHRTVPLGIQQFLLARQAVHKQLEQVRGGALGLDGLKR